MYDIVTVGEILVEVLTQETGQEFTRPGTLLGPYPSGAPAIMIDQAARMGARTAIVAKVGDDDFGTLNINRLQEAGVNTSHIVKMQDNTTGVAFVTYFQDGSRKFIYHFTHAACGELCATDIHESVFTGTKYLHVMGCSITASPQLGEAVMQAVHMALKQNVRISFDPNIRPELLNERTLTYYKEVLDCCDVLLTGKSEISALSGTDVPQAITELLAQKDRIVVVKDGARGTNVYTRDQRFHVPVYPAIEVDPTGAGDCFDGTFLAMLCADETLQTAADYASAAGALAVSKRGPMEGNARREAVEAFRIESGGIQITAL